MTEEEAFFLHKCIFMAEYSRWKYLVFNYKTKHPEMSMTLEYFTTVIFPNVDCW